MTRFFFVVSLCVSAVVMSEKKTVSAAAWTSAASYVGTKAPKISGHASCNMDEGQVFVFGGLLEDRTATNEVWVYDQEAPEQEKWNRISPQNDGPGPRMYATAARLGSKVFVVGGWDPEAKGSGGTFKDDVYSMDTKTWTWTKHAPLPCGPVSRHASCTVGDKILVFTYKEGKDGIIVLNSVGFCHAQETTGDVPVGISMCCAAPLGSHAMLLFGGSTKTQQMTNAVHMLDTNTWEWTKLENHGATIPTPRASCCMANVNQDEDDKTPSFVVFGGAGIGDMGYEGGAGLRGSSETWLLTTHLDKHVADWTSFLPSHDDTKNPPPRVAASIHKIHDNHNKFLLVGGWNPATAETYQEPWMLE